MPLNAILRALLIPIAGLFAVSANAAWAADLCADDHRPVCGLGADNVRANFQNACEARTKGATVLHFDACEAPGAAPSMCSHLYKPVCGTDSASHAAKTYPNLCTAEQANAPVRSNGACPAGPKGGG